MKKLIFTLSLIALVAAGCSNQNNNSANTTQNSNTNLATKKYINTAYGFEFQYPSTWVDAERPIETQNYFTPGPETEYFSIFQIELIPGSGSLRNVAESEIKKNNCPPTDGQPGDHLISANDTSALYTLYCNAGSEQYVYIFKNIKGQIISLSYNDDFEDGADEITKLAKLNQIVSTLKVY